MHVTFTAIKVSTFPKHGEPLQQKNGFLHWLGFPRKMTKKPNYLYVSKRKYIAEFVEKYFCQNPYLYDGFPQP
jgi:hypothetical protein